jgi:TH1 protein/WW domain
MSDPASVGGDAADASTDTVYFEWSAYYDDEGRLYYYNSVTEESSWDEPSGGFNPPPPPDEHDGDDDEGKESHREEDNTTAARATTSSENEEIDDNMPVSPNQYEEVTENDNALEPSRTPQNEPLSPSDNIPNSPPTVQPMSPAGSIQSPGRGTGNNNPATPDSTSNYPVSPDQLPSPNYPTSPAGDVQDESDGNNENDEPVHWIAYLDEEGNEYYYNSASGQTQWDKPDRYMTEEEYKALVGDDTGQDEVTDAPEVTEGTVPTDDQEDTLSAKMDEEVLPEVEPEPEVDPEVLKVQIAEDALQKADSILEPSCLANVRTVIPAHGGNAAVAIQSLIDAYHGQTAICGLLTRWFIDFKRTTAKSKSSATTETDNNSSKKISSPTKVVNMQQQNQDTEADANYLRGIAQDVIIRMAKEKFTREAGDGILDLGRTEAAFLQEMMDSKKWRELLIDLTAAHKDSAVLLYCLRAISKRGHHREIAKRINQSDHFAVFNAMLLSELAVVGCAAVSAGSDVSSSSGFDDLLNDLQRACTSTSYTYLYSVEMLRTLVSRAQEELKQQQQQRLLESDDNDDSAGVATRPRFIRALRKWEALIQLLENAMIDPAAAQSVAGSSPFLRKRRLDVALTISELQQRQRRRTFDTIANAVGGSVINEQKSSDDPKDLETAIIMLLRRYSTGTQITDAVLDKLLPTGLDMNTRGIGKLLLDHPLSIRALLGHLFKPGSTRINVAGTRNKCARLVALAVLAAEKMARDEIQAMNQKRSTGYRTIPTMNGGPINDAKAEEIDEVALTRMIVQGCQYCEQIETMISFSVTTDIQTHNTNNGNNATTSSAALAVSPGQKICALSMKSAVVGMGTIMWAFEFTRQTEFPQSASFPTISPCIMSLVRLIAMKHPATRADALQVALAFLRHANQDISYQKINALKEQALRLMIFLLLKGDVAPVLTSITQRLTKTGGTSDLDASLVRYFVGGVLDVVGSPYSPVFIRLFSTLLKAPRTVDAVRSTYFAKESKHKLFSMLQAFQKTISKAGDALAITGKIETTNTEDISLVESLLSTYQVE